MAISAKFDKGKLIVEIDMETKPDKSTSGKSIVLASTRGNQQIDGLEYKGKPVRLGLNCYVKM